ncbi:MAG: tRNA pseudouridine(13) synthase TruD [Pseudomonadota bacterium]
MNVWPTVGASPRSQARLREQPEDFVVEELLSFEPDGQGEHVLLYVEKRLRNTTEVQRQLAELAGVPARDVGFAGLKDRRAVTRQWFSVGLAGRPEPMWHTLEPSAGVRVLQVERHRRKLRRGVHRSNRFTLMLRSLVPQQSELEAALARVRAQGVPNYFGPQRFGREGTTLAQARAWMARGGRIGRERRSLYLSALRAHLFNQLLGARVRHGEWDRLEPGQVCQLDGSRSLFRCDKIDEDIGDRLLRGDLHPALPLWGTGDDPGGPALRQRYAQELSAEQLCCEFLEEKGLAMGWRPARLWPDDFSWEFCDHDCLRLNFSLPPGGYATAVLAELVCCNDEREDKHQDKHQDKHNNRTSESSSE